MTTGKNTPPPAAVAKDAHWQQTMARLNKLKPAVATMTICDDPDLRTRLAGARAAKDAAFRALEVAEGQSDPDSTALARRRAEKATTELDEAQAAFDAAAIVLRFQALPRTELEELQAKHPPTEEAEADGAAWDADSFAPALIAAASLDGMPVDYAQQCLNTWSSADAAALWNAAWQIQHQQRTDLGKG